MRSLYINTRWFVNILDNSRDNKVYLQINKLKRTQHGATLTKYFHFRLLGYRDD